MNDFSEKPTAVPAAFAAESRDKPVMSFSSEKPASVRATASWAIPLAMFHAVAWVGVFYIWLSVVPGDKYIFTKSKIRLPWLTEIVIDLSDALFDQILVWPLMFVVFGALDAAMLFLLKRARMTVIVWLWFVLLLIVPICLGAISWIGLYVALTEVEFMKGLPQ